MKITSMSFFIIFLSISVNSYSQFETLKKSFQHLPKAAKPKALWPWVQGNIDTVAIRYEIQEAKKQGLAGFDIWHVSKVHDPKGLVPQGPTFMSDTFFDAVSYAIKVAGKYDFDIGLIISSGWNAGGPWVTPEYSTKGIYAFDTIVSGPRKLKIILPKPKFDENNKVSKTKLRLEADNTPSWYRDVALIAYPYSVDSVIKDPKQIVSLSTYINKKGELEWQIPAGKWVISRYTCYPTGQPMIASAPEGAYLMIDHLDAQATEVHLQKFIEPLQKRLGDLGKSALKYLYNDSYEVSGRVWTPTLPHIFNQKNGYFIDAYLPILWGFTIKDSMYTARFLHDFKLCLSDLIIKNHYEKSKEVCHKAGINFVSEAGGPGYPIHNCPFESIKSSGVLDIARGEFWRVNENRDPNLLEQLQIIKGISCAANGYGTKIVEAEAFTSTYLWQEGPFDLKNIADWAFCQGLNRIVFHTFSHVPFNAGVPGWVYTFGTQVNTKVTWWSKSKPFMQYLGRVSHLLQQGYMVADILYYYGDSAPNFVSVKKPTANRAFGYDYDVINTELLLTKLDVKDGKWIMPSGNTYAFLVLPKDKAMNPEVLEKINKLVQKGGIILGNKPSLVYGLKDHLTKEAHLKINADKLWELSEPNSQQPSSTQKVFAGISENMLLEKLGISPDLKTSNPSSISDSVDYIHRRLSDGTDIYYVTNLRNMELKSVFSFRTHAKKPYLFNVLNGEISEIKLFTETRGYIEVPLHLERYGSAAVVFAPEKTDTHYTQAFVNGKQVYPNYSLTSIGISLNPTHTAYAQSHADASSSVSLFYQNNKPIKTFSSGAAKILLSPYWTLSFEKEKNGAATRTLTKLFAWDTSENDSLKYYSGMGTYQSMFTIVGKSLDPKLRYFIDLGQVAELAEIYVNGTTAGISWAAPYQMDITPFVKSGANHLTIEVINTWPNRLIGDSKLPVEKRITKTNAGGAPNTWSHAWHTLPNQEFRGLRTSGLIGPVQFFAVQSLE